MKTKCDWLRCGRWCWLPCALFGWHAWCHRGWWRNRNQRLNGR